MDFEVFAIVSYVVNVRNGMSPEDAKGGAVYLANVVRSRKVRGWSGQKSQPNKGSQVISSKAYVKGGAMEVVKTFGGRAMSANEFDRVVVESLGGEKFAGLVRKVDSLLASGKDPMSVKKIMMREAG